MVPEAVYCEECGATAVVRGYGRVEYDWGDGSHGDATLNIRLIRLTVDCPRCGVHVQEHAPVHHVA